MVQVNKPLPPLLIVSCILFAAIKLFTAQFFYTGDSTTGIIVRKVPSLSNTVVDVSSEKLLVIAKSENSFPGANAYRFFVSWIWWSPGTILVLILIAKHRRDSFNRNIEIESALLGLSLFLNVVAWSYFAVRILKFESRVFLNVLIVLPLPVVTMIYSIRTLIKKKVPLLSYVVFFVGIISVVGIMCLHFGDIVITYEQWLDKGMPD